MDRLENKKYPIGRFQTPETFLEEDKQKYISTIRNFPENLRKLVEALNDDQLDTAYRENGWTIRQVIHHCADSHMNSIIRFKLALTEENPTIKPYDEGKWAELADSKEYGIEPSLQLLAGLHQRWVVLLESMTDSDFEKTFYHPENKKTTSLKENLAIYAWHCDHHFAHIENVMKENNW